MKKSDFIALMLSTRAELENLLSEISPEQMTRPDVAGVWSVKDMLAHISWYQKEEAELFGETGVQTSPLWKIPQDPRNELLFAQNRDRPLAEVLSEFRQAFANLLAVVKNMTEADLNTPGRFPGTSAERLPWQAIANHSYEHDREHIEMIRLWWDQKQSSG